MLRVTDLVTVGAMTVPMSGQMTKVYEMDARRRWSDAEKRAIIEESKTAPVTRVAKKHGVAVSSVVPLAQAGGHPGERDGGGIR